MFNSLLDSYFNSYLSEETENLGFQLFLVLHLCLVLGKKIRFEYEKVVLLGGAALKERATPPFVDEDVRSVKDSLLL